MIHSKQCLYVINKCDFKNDAYKIIERYLLIYTPKQIINMVWRMDKLGKHQIEWFESILSGNYMKKFDLGISIIFDDNFWETYDIICNFIEPFDIRDIELIQHMSGDTLRLQDAIHRSKPNLKYIYKVWSDIKIVNFNDASAIIEIKKHEVNTIEFD